MAEVGPAGNASQVFTVAQSETPRPAENRQPEDARVAETPDEADVAETERVNPETNVGNNINTTA